MEGRERGRHRKRRGRAGSAYFLALNLKQRLLGFEGDMWLKNYGSHYFDVYFDLAPFVPDFSGSFHPFSWFPSRICLRFLLSFGASLLVQTCLVGQFTHKKTLVVSFGIFFFSSLSMHINPIKIFILSIICRHRYLEYVV